MKEKEIVEIMKKIFGDSNIKRNIPGRYSPSGYPDIFVIYRGDIWPVEIKINKTKLTIQQQDWFYRCFKSILIQVDTVKHKILFTHHWGSLIPRNFILIGESIKYYETSTANFSRNSYIK